ncbi:MAG: ABC transporter ATP-binding protein [Caldilineaceae bacterium SB0662_bin_9]|uniref:ABC transporter ATP-binding protein n=1 Tax=Caldilineaceae bacterium SB0662_bin_9 TaxID=2605258 RepID=A0A6B1DRM4_9CHLR|nr:ABC transporter ATP-binding protein [Caldilineaceae bacterium SB0662_bin_9]
MCRRTRAGAFGTASSTHQQLPECPFVNPPIINATDVHKVYFIGDSKVEALRGVDFSVQAGEMVAVMGPSGCGKTTLLNCLSGLDTFDQGSVVIEGQSLEKLGDRRLTRYRAGHMGFIFQSYNLLPVISAAENVELALLVNGIHGRDARLKALDMLEAVGLADWKHHRPAQLSGGQRQRVAIARALANQPAIVWADEPTGNLDDDTSLDVLNLMRHLNAEHAQTFVIVTHDPKVGDFCDRVVRMANGRMVPDRNGSAATAEASYAEGSEPEGAFAEEAETLVSEGDSSSDDSLTDDATPGSRSDAP